MAKTMMYFAAGTVSEPRFELMLKAVGFRSEQVIDTLRHYLVTGHDIKWACWLTGMDVSNFRRDLKKANDHFELVEKVKELEWPGYVSSKQ